MDTVTEADMAIMMASVTTEWMCHHALLPLVLIIAVCFAAWRHWVRALQHAFRAASPNNPKSEAASCRVCIQPSSYQPSSHNTSGHTGAQK